MSPIMSPGTCRLYWIRSHGQFACRKGKLLSEPGIRRDTITPSFFRFRRRMLLSWFNSSQLLFFFFLYFALFTVSSSIVSLSHSSRTLVGLKFHGLKSDHIHAWPTLLLLLCICKQAGEERSAIILLVSPSTELILSIRAAQHVITKTDNFWLSF